MGSNRKNIFRSMLTCKDKITNDRDKEAARKYLEVKSFVESGSYSPYKYAEDLAKLSLGGYADSYIARMLNIQENTLRVYRGRVSEQLESILGKDFFDLLANYQSNRREVDRRILCALKYNLTAEDLICSEVVVQSVMNEGSTEVFDLKDCKREISFLLRHSKSTIETELKSLDKKKLAYLIDLLNSKSSTTKISDRNDLLMLFIQKEKGDESDESNG